MQRFLTNPYVLVVLFHPDLVLLLLTKTVTTGEGVPFVSLPAVTTITFFLWHLSKAGKPKKCKTVRQLCSELQNAIESNWNHVIKRERCTFEKSQLERLLMRSNGKLLYSVSFGLALLWLQIEHSVGFDYYDYYQKSFVSNAIVKHTLSHLLLQIMLSRQIYLNF